MDYHRRFINRKINRFSERRLLIDRAIIAKSINDEIYTQCSKRIPNKRKKMKHINKLDLNP